ncbi:hypothetical protein COA07_16050 [Sphingomonas adhaesiva]|uniref:Uncharacterized protein n=1 Tax=Sphingomonas adhaesiva TaxID=28212 RepID=A0A2A4I4U5_9SPHN|nr:hypothetical protein COA07_16050 [Sphingomonas adhaesiva]
MCTRVRTRDVERTVETTQLLLVPTGTTATESGFTAGLPLTLAIEKTGNGLIIGSVLAGVDHSRVSLRNGLVLCGGRCARFLGGHAGREQRQSRHAAGESARRD